MSPFYCTSSGLKLPLTNTNICSIFVMVIYKRKSLVYHWYWRTSTLDLFKNKHKTQDSERNDNRNLNFVNTAENAA